MYSDAGFDVSKCGRFLALCELDTATASGFAATAAAPAGGPVSTVSAARAPWAGTT